MAAWDQNMHRLWPDVHIGEPALSRCDERWNVSVPVYLGDLTAADVRVECYAAPADGGTAEIVGLSLDEPVPGATGGYFYRGRIPGTRPAGDYTVRAMPFHQGIRVPAENALIRWQR